MVSPSFSFLFPDIDKSSSYIEFSPKLLYLETTGSKAEVITFELFSSTLLEVFIDLETGTGYGRCGLDNGRDWGKAWRIALRAKNGSPSAFNGNWCSDVMEWNGGNAAENPGMGMPNGR